MMLVQFLAIGLAILISVKTIFDFKNKKIGLGTFIFWMAIWLLIMVIAFLPQITIPLSKLLGVGRGVDTAVYFSIVFIFFILFEIVKKINKMEKEITEIVSEIALKNYKNGK